MSSYAYAKLYIFDKDGKVKVSKEKCVSYLKTLFEMSEWPDTMIFDYTLPNNELPPNVTELGFVNYKAVFENPEYPNTKEKIILGSLDKGFVRVGDWFDYGYYKQQKLIKNQISDTERLDSNWIKIEVQSSHTGDWTDIDALTEYSNVLKSEYEENFIKYIKLKTIKESVDYYKLNDDQKDSLNDDLSSQKDYIDYIMDKLDSVNKFIGAISWFYEDNHTDWTDTIKAYIYIE